MQALPAPPESLCIVEMGSGGDRMFSVGGLFLNIGLQNGVLLRTALDSVTGDLSDTRTRQVNRQYLFIISTSFSTGTWGRGLLSYLEC